MRRCLTPDGVAHGACDAPGALCAQHRAIAPLLTGGRWHTSVFGVPVYGWTWKAVGSCLRTGGMLHRPGWHGVRCVQGLISMHIFILRHDTGCPLTLAR